MVTKPDKLSMMKTLKPILSLSLVATFSFGLVACNPDKGEPTPEATSSSPATSAPSTSPSPGATSSAPAADPSAAPMPLESEQAQKVFSDIEVDAADGLTKEDIQLSLLGADRYVNNMYNNGYLANGSWATNGADSEELVKSFGKDWSDSYRAKVEGLIEKYKNGEEKASENLLNHFFYYDGETLTLPEDCNDNNLAANSCLVGGLVESNSDMTYQVNKETKAVYVNTSFTANVRFIKDGVQGVSPVKYNLQLEMIKNPYPDEENLRYAYIVNDLGGSWSIDNWHEGE